MEQMKPPHSLRGFIIALVLLTAVSKGCEPPSASLCFRRHTNETMYISSGSSARVADTSNTWPGVSGCDPPSAPQCFRRHSSETMYICEWSSADPNRAHYIHFSYDNSENIERTCKAQNPTSTEIKEEHLFQNTLVDIWVEADGTSCCSSNKTTVKLVNSIKYEKPQNVSVQWSQDNLTLQWKAPEHYQATAEIWHRRDSAEPWTKLQRNTTIPKNDKYDITVANLVKDSADQLQIRHRSTQAKNTLWSDWSNVLTDPIEFTRISKKLVENSRRVTLRWKKVHSPDGKPISYQVETQSFKDCPCKWKHQYTTNRTTYQIFGSYSTANISVTAQNTAGLSPPAVFQVPIENPANLELCDGTALNRTTERVCSEWYELRDGKVKTDTVIVLTYKNKKADIIKQRKEKELKKYLPYVYFEHRCTDNRPQNVKMCLYYKKEGKPSGYPQHFITSTETHNSATLSWEPIPTVHQRGFLTHYSLCIVTASSDGQPVCRNLSMSHKSYTLEDLIPGTKYNITLMGVTGAGEGPPARVTINTQPEKPVNVGLSFGLLIIFFFLSVSFTFIFTRIKNKILPPVPTPVIPEFTAYQPEIQDLLERKEEVHEVTLVQLHPEPSEDVMKSKFLGGTVDGGSDLDEDNEEGDRSLKTGSDEDEQAPKESTELTDVDQVQNEIAMLIYRNGLVFDVNVDSS